MGTLDAANGDKMIWPANAIHHEIPEDAATSELLGACGETTEDAAQANIDLIEFLWNNREAISAELRQLRRARAVVEAARAAQSCGYDNASWSHIVSPPEIAALCNCPECTKKIVDAALKGFDEGKPLPEDARLARYEAALREIHDLTRTCGDDFGFPAVAQLAADALKETT